MDTHQSEKQFDQVDQGPVSGTPNAKTPELSETHSDPLQNFLGRLARMRKDGEHGIEMESDDAVEDLNALISEARSLMKIESPFPSFGYFINLNERGYFEADVRNTAGKTVFEIKSGLSLPRGESDLIDDGFMKHANDLCGLEKYLKECKLIPAEAKLFDSNQFEQIS